MHIISNDFHGQILQDHETSEGDGFVGVGFIIGSTDSPYPSRSILKKHFFQFYKNLLQLTHDSSTFSHKETRSNSEHSGNKSALEKYL